MKNTILGSHSIFTGRAIPLIALLSLILTVVPALAQFASPIIDAQGDALDSDGYGPPLHDLDTVHLWYDDDFLHFQISFHTVISAPSAEQQTAVFGFLDLDCDQDPETGQPASQNIFSPPFESVPIGVECMLDFSYEMEHPGFALLGPGLPAPSSGWAGLSPDGSRDTFPIPIIFTPFSITGAVPLIFLEGDGAVDFSCIFGSYDQPTDVLAVYGYSAYDTPVTRSTWSGIKGLY